MIRLMQEPFLTEEGIRRRPVIDGIVECPVHGHADLEKCTACSFKVRFEGDDPLVVICGYPTTQQSGPV